MSMDVKCLTLKWRGKLMTDLNFSGFKLMALSERFLWSRDWQAKNAGNEASSAKIIILLLLIFRRSTVALKFGS